MVAQTAVAEVAVDCDSLRQVAFGLLRRGNVAQAKEYGMRLLRVADDEDGDDRDYCSLYGHLIVGLSDIDNNRGHYAEVYAHLETARTIAERTSNHDALLSVFNGLGMYSLFAGNVYSALSYQFKALEEARILGDRHRYAIILSNISGAYLMRNDLTGLKFAEEAIEIAKECDEIVPLYHGTMNVAHYYLMADSLDRAEAAIGEAERIGDIKGFTEESSHCLLRALLCEKRGDTGEAYRYYARAMDHFPSASASTITAVYLHYACLLRTDRHTDAAIRVLQQGLDWVDSGNSLIYKAQLLKELSLCYREAEQYDRALECALQYQANQDSLFDEVHERALQEARIKHEIFRREQTISSQQEVISRGRYKMTGLIALLVVLASALAMTYFFYKKKSRLYRAIVLQNRESMLREQMLMEQIEKLRRQGAAAPSGTPLPTGKQHDLMSGFTTLMMEQKLFTEPTLTVADVARALNTNRTYLSKAINESTGKTFTQVINDYRIREAIAQIADLDANKPLKQIAVEVGFSSLSTFYSTFQSSVGMTPALYRAQLRK